jgi:kynurenine 3-monooxygenase
MFTVSDSNKVFEKRGDIRKDTSISGRSINLALSTRGISALNHTGINLDLLDNLIPMHVLPRNTQSRLIHDLAGNVSSQPYGIFGEVCSA